MPSAAVHAALDKGGGALLSLTQNGTAFPAAPIGLYFASLWYYEKLYPMVHTVTALRALTDISSGSAVISK